MREIRTLRATWRGLETWNGREYHGRPARQSSTLPVRGAPSNGRPLYVAACSAIEGISFVLALWCSQ
jgi:hypothetical protein